MEQPKTKKEIGIELLGGSLATVLFASAVLIHNNVSESSDKQPPQNDKEWSYQTID